MKNVFYYLSRGVLWLLFRVGFGLTVQGQEHLPRSGGCIVAGNHVSYFDPPALGAACPRPLRFVASAELFHIPLLRLFLRGVRVIPLDRVEADFYGIRRIVRTLRGGAAVAIYPEGGRQYSGQLTEAKRGVGVLAATARVPVIPVVIKGTYDALPRGSRWPRLAKIRVAFGQGISYTGDPLSSDPSPGDVVGASAPRVGREAHQRVADAVTRQWHRLTEALE